jgi:O-antigen/teichoic acid export membrane protein
MNVTLEPVAVPARTMKATSPLRQIFHGSAWYGLAIAVNRFIPGLLTITLAWWLPQRELGIISFVLAYFGVLALVADWSIAYAVQKIIPEDKERAGQIAWTALFVRLGLSTLIGLFCWTLDATTGLFHGYGVLLIFLLIASAFGTITYVHNARCDFAIGSLFSLGFQLAWVPLALLFVKLGMTVTGPLLALCVSFAAIGIPGFLLSPGLRGRVAFLRPVAAEILRFGAWATLATLLSGFADQVGILVVAYRIGDVPAGIFKVATTFGVVPALLGMIVALPLMPVAKQSLLNGDNISADLIRPILRYLLMFGLPIVAAGFVLAPAIIRTFVRETYLGAVWPMRILLGASLLRTLVTALSGILFVGQGLKALARIHGTVAAITLTGSLFLVRSWGITGVAVANLVGWATGAVLLYLWFEAKKPIPLEWSGYFRYAGSAAVMAVCAFLVTRSVAGPNLQFLLGGCAAGIAYVSLLWIQRDLALQGLVRILRQRAVG